MFESDEDATFTLGYVTLQLQGNERKTLFYTILAALPREVGIQGWQQRQQLQMFTSWITKPTNQESQLKRLCLFSHFTQNVIITNRVLGQKQDGSVFWHFQRKRYRQVPPRTNLTCFKTHIPLLREISVDKVSAQSLLVLREDFRVQSFLKL